MILAPSNRQLLKSTVCVHGRTPDPTNQNAQAWGAHLVVVYFHDILTAAGAGTFAAHTHLH